MALAAFLMPFVVGGVILALARWVFRRVGVAGGDRAAAALAIGSGYIAGHAAIALPAFPPLEVTDRIPFLVAFATLLGFLDSVWPSPAWVRWENRLLLTALVLGAILGPVLANIGETRSEILWVAGLGVVLLASWVNLDALAARLAPAPLALSLLIITGGVGGVLLVSGSLILGQLGLALAAALAAVVVFSTRGPGLSLDRGGVPILTTIVGALLIDGHIYAGLPASAAFVLLPAPLAPWVCQLGPVRRASAWKGSALAVVVTLIPVSVALGIALAASPDYGE
jgi:hypothetical protein